MVQIAQKFEHFLQTYRRPDGSRWGGQDLHDATAGVVTRSYVTSLRKGRIENPGFEKLRAISEGHELPAEREARRARRVESPRGPHLRKPPARTDSLRELRTATACQETEQDVQA